MERIIKPAFAVIGIEGSTEDGPGFISGLWNEANSRFGEVAHLAKTNPDGTLCGIWGAMTDMSRSFRPWEDDFSRGLYLAGVEVHDDAQPPRGWARWDVPGYEYLRVSSVLPVAWPCSGMKGCPSQARCMISPTLPPARAICSSPSAGCNGRQIAALHTNRHPHLNSEFRIPNLLHRRAPQ